MFVPPKKCHDHLCIDLAELLTKVQDGGQCQNCETHVVHTHIPARVAEGRSVPQSLQAYLEASVPEECNTASR